MSLAIGLAICGAWFLHAFKKSGGLKSDSRIGLLLTWLFIGSAAQNGVMGLGTFLFAKNSDALFGTLILDHILLIIVGMLGIYTAYYIFSPQISTRLPLICMVILGLIALTLLLSTHPRPFLTAENGIDLNMNLQLSVVTFYLLLINIGSTLYIFLKLFFAAKTPALKWLSFAIVINGAAGIINIFVRLILLHGSDVNTRTHLFDLGTKILGAIFIITLAIFPLAKNLLKKCRASS